MNHGQSLHPVVAMSTQAEILLYYKRMWKAYGTFSYEEMGVLEDVPFELYVQVEFTINLQLMRRVPLFARVAHHEEFLAELTASLEQVVLLPETAVVTKGEMGDCMYFVSLGEVSIRDEDNQRSIVLTTGQYFGELSMIFGGPRSATIKVCLGNTRRGEGRGAPGEVWV